MAMRLFSTFKTMIPFKFIVGLKAVTSTSLRLVLLEPKAKVGMLDQIDTIEFYFLAIGIVANRSDF